ncbi:NAD-dependent epimerase/dehydratase family protein [Lentisalinibacter orientalis]|uniref:NAD-dependent epimerase/dehydratase family protein n=1 Tax=Lentisalinibacter orientalis TaxID=2992241 RepID=UPI003870D033
MSVIVTGASGFIGQHLCANLDSSGISVRRLVRRACDAPGSVVIEDLGARPSLDAVLEGVDCIVHAAGLAHGKASGDGQADLVRINVNATRWLAEEAVAKGVKRFVFLSSIGVLGSRTEGGGSLDENSLPNPLDPYSVSKKDAEVVLQDVAVRTGLEVVIVRPPLVYGPGAPGNFSRLVKLVASGLPLPLASVDNRRAVIGIDNLVEFLVLCMKHPNAAGHSFLVSDGRDLSTPEFVRKIAAAMGRSAHLFPCPPRLLEIAGKAIGRSPELQRLLGSLQVDISHTRERLGWSPSMSIGESLRRAFASQSN